MRRRSKSTYQDDHVKFDHVDSLIAYLEYAMKDVEAVSHLGGSLLKLTISTLKADEDEPSSLPKPTLS